MFKRFNANYMALFLLADAALMQGALLIALSMRYSVLINEPWPHVTVQNVRAELHVGVGLLGLLGFIALSVYDPRKVMRWIDEAQRVVLANAIVCFSFAGALYLINLDLPRLGFIYFFVLSTFLLAGYRLVLRAIHRLRQDHPDELTRVLVAGAGRTGRDVVEELRKNRWPGLHLVGFLDDDAAKRDSIIIGLPVLGTLNEARRLAVEHRVDEVLIALPPHAHQRLTDLVALLYDQPVRVRVVPDFSDLALHNATIESMGGVLLVGLRDPAIDGVQRLLKRLMDIVFSALVLLFLWPVFLITALAIKLEDGGPVFYRSRRAGENGKQFTMLKFRSMVPNAEELQESVLQQDGQGNVIHKHSRDPRVTRVGRVIRRTSIDELPQLFNVLRGEMSLVGPRPELPWMVEKYQLWQRKRFAVPQGITGWWQISGRSDAPMHLHTEHDLYYIQNYSLWLDVQILWRTMGAIVTGRGAY